MTRRGRDLVIRPDTPADASVLHEIAMGMDVEARIRLGVDRGADFHAFNRVRYDVWDTLLAERKGEILGFLDIGFSKYRVGSLVVRGNYAGLVAVREGSRGTPVFAQLAAAGAKACADHESRIGLSIANTANDKIPRMLQRLFPGARQGVPIHGVCVLLGPSYGAPGRHDCGPVTAEELPEVDALMVRERGHYAVSHTLPPHAMERLPGARLEDLLVARHRGRVVASLGLWDQSALRRTVVCGYGKQEMWLRLVFNRLRGLGRMAPLPALGEALRIVHTLFAAAEPGYEHAWGALLRHACRRLSGQGHNLLVVGLPETSPLLRACRGLPRFTNVNIPLVLPWDEETDAELAMEGPPSLRLEYALI